MISVNDVLIEDVREDAIDGGDMVLGSDFGLTVGIDNNVYLCLFGGNVEDNPDEETASGDERLDFWGNGFFKVEDSAFESRFERSLKIAALNSEGRASIEAAARRDLKPMEKIGTVEVSATIPRLNVLQLSVTVTEKTTGIPTEFIYIWDAEREQFALEQRADTEVVSDKFFDGG